MQNLSNALFQLCDMYLSEFVSQNMKNTLLILTILLVFSNSQFQKSPNQKFYTGQSWGCAVKVSPDNNYVIVGYRSGNLAIYNSNGNYYGSRYGYHNTQIVTILWPKGYGPVTIDKNGIAVRWTTGFSYYGNWTLGGQPSGAAFIESANNYIAFNLGNRIVQYYFDFMNTQSGTYNAPGGQNYTALQYSKDRQYLYTGMTNGAVIVYSGGSGAIFYTFTTYYPLKKIQLIQQNGYLALGLDSNDYVYQLNQYGILSYMGSTSTTLTLSYCPSTDYYVIAFKYFYQVDVFNKNSGANLQFLNYFDNAIQSVDCSSSYLVTVDDYGYLTINTYSGFPGWVIGLIVGAVVIIIIVVIVIVVVKRKQMQRRAQGVYNYNKMDNNTGSNPYFSPNTNNQGFNNQGFNSQGYNNQVGSNPYQIQNVQAVNSNQGCNNPYQANQPRNWN